jgi:hypothetical protein
MSRSRPSPDEPAAGSALELRTRDPLARIAYLLGPSNGAGVYAPAGDSWRPPSTSGDEPVVFGRPALPSGTGRRTALRQALARERALSAIARQGGRVHRIPPQALGGGRARNALRSFLLGGAVAELGRATVPRILDVAATAADLRLGERLHLSAGGSVIVRVEARGTPAIFRVGVAGAPGDPERGAEALAHLAAIDMPVPRLLATGTTVGASWSLETALGGQRPDALSLELFRHIAKLWAAMPAGNGPPAAPRRDLEALAALLPDRADLFRRLGESVRAPLRSLPSTMRHGDLWVGNLLVDDGRLTGIVDWDAWDPGAVPGADLLHLHATSRRIAERCQLGDVFARRPWRDEAFRATLRGPAAEVPAEVLAVAWWAGEVRGTVSRHPARAADERWLAVNVDAVLRTLRP